MSNKKYISGFMILAVLATLTIAIPVLAQTTPSTNGGPDAWGGHMTGKGGPRSGIMKPGVFGTVSAVNGNIITVTGKQGFGATATTTVTYTVDATNAKVMKNNATSTVANIAVGDTIMAQGTLTGTNLVATMIRDGVMMRGTKNSNGTTPKPMNQTSPITGNGQPVIAGAVSSINGSILTITNKSNVTYTIDTTNAKIVQGQNTIAIGAIAQGDNIIAQGTISGTSMTASSVIDQKPDTASTTNGTKTATQPNRGFFGSIGHFFSSLFGF
jgi:hypothetical protein